jgi:hypothetical protein
METKLQILSGYFKAIGVDSEEISPNLVASVISEYWPNWELTSEQVVFLSDNL